MTTEETDQPTAQTTGMEVDSGNIFFRIMFPDACGLPNTATREGKATAVADALAFDAGKPDAENKMRITEFGLFCLYLRKEMPLVAQYMASSMPSATLKQQEDCIDKLISFNQGRQDTIGLLEEACKIAYAKSMENIYAHALYLQGYSVELMGDSTRLIVEGAHLIERKNLLAISSSIADTSPEPEPEPATAPRKLVLRITKPSQP